MRVLLTGGSGFIGSSVLTFLEETDNEVLSFSRNAPQSKKKSNITWSRIDLSQPSTYKNLVNDFKPETLIHLAWQDIPDFSLSKSQQNLVQSQNLIDTVLRTESCRKVMVSGSCFELDNRKGEKLESDIGSPTDDFTWAKHSLRSWLEIACSKRSVKWGWFRIFYAYGPGQRAASLLPTLLRSLAENITPPVNRPSNQNDFIYVDDIAQAFLNGVKHDWESGIFNLGSGTPISVLEMFRIAEWCVHRSDVITQKLVSKTLGTGIDVSFWANTLQAQTKLHWKPMITLEEGITRTWKSVSLR